MSTLFIGDVHGCADELALLLGRANPDRVVLVGDLFTRGPDPVGVWKLIKRWNALAVLGNHDAWVLENWTPGKELPRKAFKWLREQPHLRKGKGWLAVHGGVRPDRPLRTRPEEAMTMSHWGEKPWWKSYRGKRLVVHGHDARTGLNDRRPYTLGLDTGCVKGGSLTGYLLEKDALITVRAR